MPNNEFLVSASREKRSHLIVGFALILDIIRHPQFLATIGYWLLAIGYWLLAIGYRLPALRSIAVDSASRP